MSASASKVPPRGQWVPPEMRGLPPIGFRSAPRSTRGDPEVQRQIYPYSVQHLGTTKTVFRRTAPIKHHLRTTVPGGRCCRGPAICLWSFLSQREDHMDQHNAALFVRPTNGRCSCGFDLRGAPSSSCVDVVTINKPRYSSIRE